MKVRKTSSREGGASRAIGKKRAVPPIHQVPRRVAWWLKRLGIPELWKQGLTGEGVLVGHPDTGVDADHPASRTPSPILRNSICRGSPFPDRNRMIPTRLERIPPARSPAGYSIRQQDRWPEYSTHGVRRGPCAILASAIVIEGGEFERPDRGGNGLAPGSRG